MSTVVWSSPRVVYCTCNVGDAHTSLGHLISENVAGPRTLGLSNSPTLPRSTVAIGLTLSAPLSDSCLQCGPVGSLLDGYLLCHVSCLLGSMAPLQEPSSVRSSFRPTGSTKPKRPWGNSQGRQQQLLALEGGRGCTRECSPSFSPSRCGSWFLICCWMWSKASLVLSPHPHSSSTLAF